MAKPREWYNIHEEPSAGMVAPFVSFHSAEKPTASRITTFNTRPKFEELASQAVVPMAPFRSIEESPKPMLTTFDPQMHPEASPPGRFNLKTPTSNDKSWFKSGFIWLATLFFTAFQTWCCTFAVSTVLYKFSCTSSESSAMGCIPLDTVPGFGPFFQLQHRLSQMADKLDNIDRKLSQLEDQFPADFPTRDFALWGLGASIITDLTTATARGPSVVILPSAVLEDPPTLGECWEFMGRKGWIGIRLSESANVTAMSINYVRPSRLTKRFRSKIPRSLILWGLVPSNVTPPTSLDVSRPAQDFVTNSETTLNLGDSVLVPLVRAHYDDSPARSRQIFSVTSSIAKSLLFDIVVVEILDNWGGESTCLYHIGVHGFEV